MKKSSTIFKMICLAIATVLCLSALPAIAEDAAADIDVVEDVTEEIQETTEELTEQIEEETQEASEETSEEVTEEATEEVTEETTEEATEEATEEVTEEVTEETTEEPTEEEVVDLFTATLRDGGQYVTPGENNIAVFVSDGVRYKVEAGMGNSIKLEGFETNHKIETEEIKGNAKYRLYAPKAEITTDAAHSGYFGLSVASGDVIYRVPVSGNQVYVFSAWVNMPAEEEALSDYARAFRVVGTDLEGELTGSSYIVGWNEVGREIEATNGWQQILFVFNSPESGLFEISFKYRGTTPLMIDDIELYEASLFENPITITEVVATDADGNEFINTETGLDENFTTTGKITHKTVLYNEDEDDVYFVAIGVLYKDDIFVSSEWIPECALVQDEAEVVFEFEIPENEDPAQYKYMVYFVEEGNFSKFLGEVPDKINPYVVEGK